MMTDRTGGISIVGGNEVVTMGEEIDRGDGVGKVELLGGGVCSGNHKSVCSVERGQVVHPGVVMFDWRVVEDKGQDDKVAADVKEEELMMYNK